MVCIIDSVMMLFRFICKKFVVILMFEVFMILVNVLVSISLVGVCGGVVGFLVILIVVKVFLLILLCGVSGNLLRMMIWCGIR